MSNVTVILSEQDLSDFFEGNQKYMDAYATELQRRLAARFDSASVEISRDALSDRIDIDGEGDAGVVAGIEAQMVNDWDWLEE